MFFYIGIWGELSYCPLPIPLIKSAFMGMAEDLDLIDAKINKLKIDYDQYFAKSLKREPASLRSEIDRLIIRCANQQTTNTSLKFRYSTLVSKYTSYKQLWDRILRQIADGTYGRGMDARRPEQQAGVISAAALTGVEAKTGISSMFADVYRQYIEARKTAGEPPQDIPYEKFTQFMKQNTEKAKQELKCDDVEYKIIVKDGKSRITILPKGKK